MTLKELQEKMLVDEAKRHFIKKGKLPTSIEIANYIKGKLKNTIAGLPLFRPIFGEKYEVASKEDFNTMIEDIHRDLTSLYNADTEANNEILSLFNLYENEKKNCTSSIGILQRKLDAVLYAMDNDSVKASVIENFDTFDDIDFEGDSKRNVPETDAYVNLMSNYASNDIKYTNIIDLTNATISFEVDGTQVANERLSDIKNAINNNIAETWLQKITMESSAELVSRLIIELPTEQMINTINVDLSSPRKMKVKCTISYDGKNETKLLEKESYNECEWNFKNTLVNKIVFEIVKSEHDDTDGVNYIYYIGAKKISLFNHVYQKESVMVSTPFDISTPFSQIALKADAAIPQQTSIKMYAGIETSAEKSISWIGIEPGENELNLLATSKENVTNVSTSYGMKYDDDLFVACELPHTPVDGSIQLDIGMNMWECREIAYDEKTPLRDVYYEQPIRYIEATTIKFSVPSKTTQMISIVAITEDSINLKATIETDDGLTRYIFVNGTTAEGTQEDGTYNIRLARGINKINVLAVNKTDETLSYTFDAYFKDISAKVLATTDSEQIDSFDIKNTIGANAYTKYAVVDNKIIVNYNPRIFGMKYQIAYCYDASNMFDNAKLRVMSVIQSETDQLTPKLYGYQLSLLAKPKTEIGDETSGNYDGMYLVTFIDSDGTVLKKEYVVKGFDATPPLDPIRQGNTFTGWTGDYTNVEKDVTIKATYDVTEYIVIFKNWDGTVLSTQSVLYGDDAKEPTTPTAPPVEADGKNYLFAGWSEPFTNVSSDLVIYAVFKKEIPVECTFIDWDGKLIEEKTVPFGTDVTPPDDPERIGYEFIGWNVDMGDIPVTFIDYDNSVVAYMEVNSGSNVTPPPDPERIGYEFIGWNVDLANIECTFQNDDGSFIDKKEVPNGGTVTPPAAPIKKGYEFIGWNVDVKPCTITFLNDDNTILSRTVVNKGSTITPPTKPIKKGYEFTGWVKE